MTKTLVVNLYGGPCTFKSAVCGRVFSDLKWAYVSCEMALEYAKDIVYESELSPESEKIPIKLMNQVYIFGKQHHRINRLLGQVDVIITDSPLLLSMHYASEEKHQKLRDMALAEYNKMWNLDILMKRGLGYDPKGRTQTREQAVEIDKSIENILKQNVKTYHEFPAEKLSQDKIVELVLHTLKTQSE